MPNGISCLALLVAFSAASEPPASNPLLRTVDLNIGETAEVKLCDGSKAALQLLSVEETRDPIRRAVREARVAVLVNGQRADLVAACYRLPQAVGGVQIDCAVTKGCVQAGRNAWALDKDARLRLWPADSPWIRPDTFRYPLRQRWFANEPQMANEPVDSRPRTKTIYYHDGLDVFGAEGLEEVFAASDAVVISAGTETIKPADFPDVLRPRYDVVYLRDARGWYHRYSHLHSIDSAIRSGVRVKMGQRLGLLGKEGASGGYSHLHFGITAVQPSGRYGSVEAYAFFWQTYHAEYKDPVTAVARPHQLTPIGRPVTLDGSRSASAKGPGHIARYEWIFSDGSRAEGQSVQRSYARPGLYSEILKVTDRDGNIDYDFAAVHVLDPAAMDRLPPILRAEYYPTLRLKPGLEITFRVRSARLRPDEGNERWYFGDGSPTVVVRSDGNVKPLARDGYAVTTHRYARPGDYLVKVERSNDRGETATARLHVRVEGP